MVRRWSCVNNINFKLTLFSSSYFLKKRYKFINFKSSVSLKRFNKKYTKFKRKAFNRIKHLTNWNIYHNVFNQWSKNYYFFKKSNKNQFLNCMFKYNFTFYNFIFLRNEVIRANLWPFTFFNQIKKQNNYFFFFASNSIYAKNNIYSTKNLNKFFTHSSFQIEENPVTVGFSDYFLLKDPNKELFQNTENKNFLIEKYKFLIFRKVIILKLKVLFEYYKILTTALLLNLPRFCGF